MSDVYSLRFTAGQTIDIQPEEEANLDDTFSREFSGHLHSMMGASAEDTECVEVKEAGDERSSVIFLSRE